MQLGKHLTGTQGLCYSIHLPPRVRGNAFRLHDLLREEIAMRMSYASCFLLAALTATSTSLAGEQVLEFKLVTKPIDLKVTEVANIEGETVMSGKMFGVAFFKDGRVAVKDFVHSADLLKGSGPFYGYSTYTFDDGSSITARYTGSVKDGLTKGDYTILSGTGAYANASGTGGFESVKSTFKGAGLFDGRIIVKTP
jgi:hypothetical protein